MQYRTCFCLKSTCAGPQWGHERPDASEIEAAATRNARGDILSPQLKDLRWGQNWRKTMQQGEELMLWTSSLHDCQAKTGSARGNCWCPKQPRMQLRRCSWGKKASYLWSNCNLHMIFYVSSHSGSSGQYQLVTALSEPSEKTHSFAQKPELIRLLRWHSSLSTWNTFTRGKPKRGSQEPINRFPNQIPIFPFL